MLLLLWSPSSVTVDDVHKLFADKLKDETPTNERRAEVSVAIEARKVEPTIEPTIVPLTSFSAVKRGAPVLVALNVAVMDPTIENVAAVNQSEPLPRLKIAFEPLPESIWVG